MDGLLRGAMARMNWDRVRRENALFGAEAVHDPDGTVSYQKPPEQAGGSARSASRPPNGSGKKKTRGTLSPRMSRCAYCGCKTRRLARHRSRCPALVARSGTKTANTPAAVARTIAPFHRATGETVARARSVPPAPAPLSSGTAADLVECPLCHCKVRPDRVQRHAKRCPAKAGHRSPSRPLSNRSRRLPNVDFNENDAMAAGRTLLGGHFEGNRRRH